MPQILIQVSNLFKQFKQVTLMTFRIMMNLRMILKLSSKSTTRLFLPIQMRIHSSVDIGEEVKIDVDTMLVNILTSGENTSHSSERQFLLMKNIDYFIMFLFSTINVIIACFTFKESYRFSMILFLYILVHVLIFEQTGNFL